MRFCFILGWAWMGAVSLLQAASQDEGTIRTVVRVDKRSGRLVRQVVVPPSLVASRVVAPQPVSQGQSPALETSPIFQLIEEISAKYRVDPLIVHSIIYAESSYDRFALSPKGAQGLMQLIPSTARRYGVKHSFDSRENIEGGIQFLRHLLDTFPDLRHVFAAYNAGEQAVTRYRGVPPYPETQEYVYRVGKRLGELRRSQATTSTARLEAMPAPAPPAREYNPLEAFVDDQGRLNLRTR